MANQTIFKRYEYKYLLTADLSHGDLTVRDEVLCRLMSCAYYLAVKGYPVTVFEKEK